MFGIRLPLNFNSPYKAANIIDFWRRWHMTLSRFLRDYLYLPLGGNRKGTVAALRQPAGHHAARRAVARRRLDLRGLGRRCTGSIWCINHAWTKSRTTLLAAIPISWPEKRLAWLLTFLAVVVGWVFFRAQDTQSAVSILHAMTGGNGVLVPNNWPGAWYLYAALDKSGLPIQLGVPVSQFDPRGTSPYWIAALLGIAWIMPNTQQFMARFEPALESVTAPNTQPIRQPSIVWATAVGLVAVVALLNLTRVSEFLYFQF